MQVERKYDPRFAITPKPNHDGECQFVRFNRYCEKCKLPGCPVGRISRDWMDSMLRMYSAHNTRSEHT
jgi:hypothetical protein